MKYNFGVELHTWHSVLDLNSKSVHRWMVAMQYTPVWVSQVFIRRQNINLTLKNNSLMH